MRLAGCVGNHSRMSFRWSNGSSPLMRVECTSVVTATAPLPARSDPANSQLGSACCNRPDLVLDPVVVGQQISIVDVQWSHHPRAGPCSSRHLRSLRCCIPWQFACLYCDRTAFGAGPAPSIYRNWKVVRYFGPLPLNASGYSRPRVRVAMRVTIGVIKSQASSTPCCVGNVRHTSSNRSFSAATALSTS